MKSPLRLLAALILGVVALFGLVGFASKLNPTSSPADQVIASNATRMIEEGRQTFRFDTFGDEDFWGGPLSASVSKSTSTRFPRICRRASRRERSTSTIPR